MDKLTDNISSLLAPVISEMGYKLVSVDYEKGELTVIIDNDEGVTPEDCANVSRKIGKLLDETDPIRESYSLIVSSPGVTKKQ